MYGIKVAKVNDDLVIHWQLSKIEIPISEIIDVLLDDTYGGEPKNAIRIGTPMGTTDRIVIKTTTKSYILFTTNVDSILKKINSAMSS